jgi:hypothetical protein
MQLTSSQITACLDRSIEEATSQPVKQPVQAKPSVTVTRDLQSPFTTSQAQQYTWLSCTSLIEIDMVLEVVLHVYDLSPSNRYTLWMGLGAFHTGVTVGQREYTFSPAGIVAGVPRDPSQALGSGDGQYVAFRESIVLGEISDMSVCNGAVASLRRSFPPESYDVVRHNCNHFTDALSHALFGKHIPKWVNRAPRIGHALLSKAPKSGGDAGPSGASGRKVLSKREEEAMRKKLHEQRNERPQVSAKQKQALAKLRKQSATPAGPSVASSSLGNNQVDTGEA